jgi:hypothetical protein
MAMSLKPGTRLLSAVCATEMIAVRVPAGELEITIGGVAPALAAEDRDVAAGAQAGHDGGALMGKRYVDDADTIELLCTKPGPGVPAVGGALLHVKEAKALPSSD